jgi:alpha-galactosidase/6-phospho-beta-glucosidase family protein
MKYSKGKVSDIQIAYIGGGSRGWAWTFMTDLALEDEISGTIRLYDIDRKAAQTNEVIGNHLMNRPEAKGDWKFEVKDSLKEVLTGCDFAVISILPGTFDEMASDVHLPERLGIYQSVGDTAGPGGIIRGLRTIPMFVEIAEAIKKYAPDCWVINYTNPMSLCVKTLYHVFPQIKAFGCCHEVFGTQKVLRGIYEEETGDKIADWHDIHVNVVGINHFTWFTEASYKGVDLFPVYKNYIDHHFEEGYQLEGENWMNSSFKCANRVKMDLFCRYGLIAAAGDRHLAEFMPGNEYLNDPETVASWKFGLTTVDWRKEDLKKRLERSHRLAAGEEEIDLSNVRLSKKISKVLVLDQTPQDIEALNKMYSILGNIERIGDHAMNLAEYAQTIQEKNLNFSDYAKNEFKVMDESCALGMELLRKAAAGDSDFTLEKIQAIEQKIDDITDNFRQNQIDRMREGHCNVESSILYSEMLTDYERIGDHMLNIGEAYDVIQWNSDKVAALAEE